MAIPISSLFGKNSGKDSNIPLRSASDELKDSNISSPETPDESYDVIPQQSTSLAQDLLRHGTRVTARFAESFAGLPGDVVQLFDSLMNLGINGLTGTLAKEQTEKFREEYAKKLPSGVDSYKYKEFIPTSSKIREYITTPVVESLAGKGYLEPRDNIEQLGDDIIGDIAAFMFPIGGKISFKNALKTAGFGNIAKLAAKEIGVPEAGQEGIKLGTMIAVNLAGPRKFKDIADKLYGDARKALPEGATINEASVRPVMAILEKLEERGDLPASWSDKMMYFKTLSEREKIPVADIWDLSKDINNAFYKEKMPAGFARMFPKLKEGINSALQSYGKVNPRFYNSLVDANDIFSALQKGNIITQTLERAITPEKIGLATAGLLFGKYSPITLGLSVGGSLAGQKLFKTLDVLKKSRAARKYFYQTIQSAAKKNLRQTGMLAQKLDQALTKQLEHPENDIYEVVPASQESWENTYEVVSG